MGSQSYATPGHDSGLDEAIAAPENDARNVAEAAYGNADRASALGLSGALGEGDTAQELNLAVEVEGEIALMESVRQPLSSIAGSLPPQRHYPRAREIMGAAELTALALRDEIDGLAEVPAGSGGTQLAEIGALRVDLAGQTALLAAYLELAERAHELRMRELTPALLAVFVGPQILASLDELAALNGLLFEISEAHGAFKAAVVDGGETVVQFLAQWGFGSLIALAAPVGLPGVLLTAAGIFASNKFDAALGSEPDNLASAVSDVGARAVAIGDGVNAVHDWYLFANKLDEGGCLKGLTSGALENMGIALDVLDATDEGLDAGKRAIDALTKIGDLKAQLPAAQQALQKAVAELVPALEAAFGANAAEVQLAVEAFNDALAQVDAIDPA